MPRKSYSPLRYPGGKQNWMPIVLNHWEKHGLKPNVFVEPFAGGAGLSLALIAEGHLKHVVLAEKHYGIRTLLKTLRTLYWNDELMRLFECPNKDDFSWSYSTEQAFLTLHANYTNYQGILHPHARKGENRWDVQKIAKKLRQCHSILKKARVEFLEDYTEAFNEFDKLDYGFCFIDPPYYKQGARLYQHSFNDKDHVELCETLQRGNEFYPQQWMLAYDNHPRIWELYHWATIQVHPNGKELIITS